LFADAFTLDPTAVTRAMRAYHPSMANARCEVVDELNREGKIFGLASWGEHVIQLVGFDVPMPKETIELCVAPSHYAQPLKERARGHQGHMLLWYAGAEEAVVEKFVALAAFAGVLDRCGAIVVLNESARTSLPTVVLAGKEDTTDTMERLRTMPLPMLYCGFVKHNVPKDTHVWMRTYGAYVLKLPDLAAYTKGHHEGQRTFDRFDSILRYMLGTGKRLAAGHTMQLGANYYLRSRAPRRDEPWLESAGEVLVVEVIRPDQINP
jgi:hypothetical protein